MERVAYISADYGVPIFGTKGCSIHAQEVLAAMLRRGATVDLFSTNVQGEPPAKVKSLQVHPLPRAPKGEPAAREKAALQLNELLQAELESAGPFDLIYERYSLWSYSGTEFAKAQKIPAVLEVNAPLIDEQQQYRVLVDRPAAELVARRAFAAAAHVIAVSKEVAAWVKSFAPAEDKVHVVSNGIDPARFPEFIEPARLAPGEFTVGFVGTLKAWHGVDVLIDAFRQLHADEPDTRLLIVGDGPERGDLQAKALAQELGASVVFTGAVPACEVPGLIASMDIAVAPYPALEHFYFSPLKVFEYMAAARAVVASAIGQLLEIIESESTGILVPPGDSAALASALRRLKKQPELRRRLGAAARADVLQSHTWDQVVARIFRLAAKSQVPTQTAVLK